MAFSVHWFRESLGSLSKKGMQKGYPYVLKDVASRMKTVLVECEDLKDAVACLKTLLKMEVPIDKSPQLELERNTNIK